ALQALPITAKVGTQPAFHYTDRHLGPKPGNARDAERRLCQITLDATSPGYDLLPHLALNRVGPSRLSQSSRKFTPSITNRLSSSRARVGSLCESRLVLSSRPPPSAYIAWYLASRRADPFGGDPETVTVDAEASPRRSTLDGCRTF